MTDEQSLWVDVYDDTTEFETPEGKMNLKLSVIYEEEEQVAKFKLYWFSAATGRGAFSVWAVYAKSDDQPPVWMEKFTTNHVTLCRGRSDAIRQGQAWYKGQVKEARQLLTELMAVDEMFEKRKEKAQS